MMTQMLSLPILKTGAQKITLQADSANKRK